MDIQKLWSEAEGYLKNRLGETVFETWIQPLKAHQSKEGHLRLEAPDSFFKDWVEKHYKPIIQEALQLSAQSEVTVTLEANPKPKDAYAKKPTLEKIKKSLQDLPDSLLLNSRYTFDNFVVGSSNRHAHAYSLAVAESPAKAYNPLFIYGGVGLGKTHLIQAICNHIKNKATSLKICYIASERFTNELIDAIQHRSTAAFRQKYRNVDLLVIDDIHFIAGKESTQEEFFHTFNALYDAHRQIIIASDRPPKEISKLQERLISRFAWGLIADVQPPDFETRVAILKKKIEHEPVKIPDEVIYLIAELIKTNIRELEGALIRVIAYGFLEEKIITLDLAKDILKDLIIEPAYLITVDTIQKTVASEFGLSISDLKNKKRSKNLVIPRQIAIYLSRELTELSLPEIGESFGGKDHTTILYSYNKVKKEAENNSTLKDKIDRIKKLIKN